MTDDLEFFDSRRCGACGKEFPVLYPTLWRYKRIIENKHIFYCTYSCYRAGEEIERNKRDMKKLTLEEKKKAVEIALGGENAVAYLRSIGIKNPASAWSNIRKSLKEKDPETWKKIQPQRGRSKNDTPKTAGEAVAACGEAADKFFQGCKDMGLLKKTNTPEMTIDGDIRLNVTDGTKVDLVYDGAIAEEYRKERKTYPVTGIRTDYGEFYYDHKFNSIDWRTEGGDEIGMGPIAWKNFAEELQDILRTLGVDVHE